jgi:hypothetical protein
MSDSKQRKHRAAKNFFEETDGRDLKVSQRLKFWPRHIPLQQEVFDTVLMFV